MLYIVIFCEAPGSETKHLAKINLMPILCEGYRAQRRNLLFPHRGIHSGRSLLDGWMRIVSLLSSCLGAGVVLKERQVAIVEVFLLSNSCFYRRDVYRRR